MCVRGKPLQKWTATSEVRRVEIERHPAPKGCAKMQQNWRAAWHSYAQFATFFFVIDSNGKDVGSGNLYPSSSTPEQADNIHIEALHPWLNDATKPLIVGIYDRLCMYGVLIFRQSAKIEACTGHLLVNALLFPFACYWRVTIVTCPCMFLVFFCGSSWKSSYHLCMHGVLIFPKHSW